MTEQARHTTQQTRRLHARMLRRRRRMTRTEKRRYLALLGSNL